jgi:hypothetical protein
MAIKKCRTSLKKNKFEDDDGEEISSYDFDEIDKVT